MTLDLRLYGILDPEHSGGRPLADLARAAVAGGATLLQVRDKKRDGKAFAADVAAVVEAVKGAGVPVLVNDRIDVAAAAGADGVHLGQDDLAPAVARRLLGVDAIIGVTIRTDAEARETPLDDADYAAIGGVFQTGSKVNETPPVGLDGVARLSAMLRDRKPCLPLCAIAGIDASNAASVVAAGVDGVSVISALFAADDVTAAAEALRRAVDAGLERRAA